MRGLKHLAESAKQKKWLLAPGWCGFIRTTCFFKYKVLFAFQSNIIFYDASLDQEYNFFSDINGEAMVQEKIFDKNDSGTKFTHVQYMH